jgi:hypothetical protein
MSQLANCSNCDHKHTYTDGGYCYQFREEPHETCQHHTLKFIPNAVRLKAILAAWAAFKPVGPPIVVPVANIFPPQEPGVYRGPLYWTSKAALRAAAEQKK